MKLSLPTGLAAGLLALAAAPALAAPVTVDFRVEGATRTLFEGPVTTDVRPFNFTAGEPHECDGEGAKVTSGAVIAAAAESAPFALAGTWNDGFGSPTFDAVAGEDVRYDPVSERYLAEYRNGVTADVGSCDVAVTTGDRVVFAYATFGARVLQLGGPAAAKPGETVTLKVTDAATSEPVAGAVVGGRASAPDGTVSAGPWSESGPHDLKAELSGWVRSNRVRVDVTPAGTPLPGTVPAAADRTPPAGTLPDVRDGSVLTRGPRQLRGSFAADPSGIRVVKLRLTKRLGKRCWYFSGRSERFRRTGCGKGAYFAIGDRADWSYLLPERLGRGRYVLDAIAVDGAGNRSPLARDRTRVVFKVR
jgi:hypothetical protein